MSVKPPESFIRGRERAGSNYTPSSLLCDYVRVLWCQWWRERKSTRAPEWRGCVMIYRRTSMPTLARLCVMLPPELQPRLFPQSEKNKSKLFCLIICSHSRRRFLFPAEFLMWADLFTCWVCLRKHSGVASDWNYIGNFVKNQYSALLWGKKTLISSHCTRSWTDKSNNK